MFEVLALRYNPCDPVNVLQLNGTVGNSANEPSKECHPSPPVPKDISPDSASVGNKDTHNKSGCNVISDDSKESVDVGLKSCDKENGSCITTLSNNNTSANAPVSDDTSASLRYPSLRLLEHCAALDPKGPTAAHIQRMKKLVIEASNADMDLDPIEVAVRNFAVDLGKSTFDSWLESRRCNRDADKAGCDWCDVVILNEEASSEECEDGITPVSSEVLLCEPLRGNIRLKKDTDNMGTGLGCFPIYLPINFSFTD